MNKDNSRHSFKNIIQTQKVKNSGRTNTKVIPRQKPDTITSKQRRSVVSDKTLSSPEIRTKTSGSLSKKVVKPSKKRVATCKSYFLEDKQRKEPGNCYSEYHLVKHAVGDHGNPARKLARNIAIIPEYSPFQELKKKTCTSKKGSCKSTALSNHANIQRNAEVAQRPITMALPHDEPQREILRELMEADRESKKTARVIRDLRQKLLEMQKKPTMTDSDAVELAEKNDILCRELDRFDEITRKVQTLIGAEVSTASVTRIHDADSTMNNNELLISKDAQPTSTPTSTIDNPRILVCGTTIDDLPKLILCDGTIRSQPEIDMTRKLSESYDMQEMLVEANADLEGKRYILYKELISKDQSLEMYRSQISKLQNELKRLSKENAVLVNRINKNNPEGDASTMNQKPCGADSIEACVRQCDLASDSDELLCPRDLQVRLQQYNVATCNIEKQISSLEKEMHGIKSELDSAGAGAAGRHACRGGGPSGCFQQSKSGPPFPPQSKNCGLCPPCPASCNPNAPPTPAEKEVGKLSVQLKMLEEDFKTKVTECAMLRCEAVKRKEELEKERCMRREMENKVREIEMKFQGLATHTNMTGLPDLDRLSKNKSPMRKRSKQRLTEASDVTNYVGTLQLQSGVIEINKMLGTKEQAFEQETSVRNLKNCYREAKAEIEELRKVVNELNDQAQEYRVKYMQAQQLVEEQRRQMDMLDMDNTRISEQINLEIQRVKLKFQEKLQELAPLPDILKHTQTRLKEAQQSQAIAEHNAESLARELHSCREKVHLLLHNAAKTPEKPEKKDNLDEKQMQLLQQKIQQLTETNVSLKGEQERLKANVIRLEEAVLVNEKRLHEKMHECAQLGGELDRARDESARAISRAHERTDTVRRCLQTNVAELERQLAASRAQYATASKDRDELRERMQCQINKLNDSFQQAQLRILGLQGQVRTLRNTAPTDFDGDGEGDVEPCSCRSMFEK